jgi:hypothetical protein
MTGNGHQPVAFDLDAARAARAEATRETFPFVFGGDRYEVKPTDEWSLDTAALLSEGDVAAAVPLLLEGGDEAFAKLRANGANLGDLRVLFEEVGRWAGVGGLPNSSPPQPPASIPT